MKTNAQKSKSMVAVAPGGEYCNVTYYTVNSRNILPTYYLLVHLPNP